MKFIQGELYAFFRLLDGKYYQGGGGVYKWAKRIKYFNPNQARSIVSTHQFRGDARVLCYQYRPVLKFVDGEVVNG